MRRIAGGVLASVGALLWLAPAASAISFSGGTSYVTGALPTGIALSDLNHDGNLDMAVPNQTPSTISVLLGDGAGGFGAATSFSTIAGLGGNRPREIAVADFDGDGNPDLATSLSITPAFGAGLGGSRVAILLGNGSGSFGAATTYSVGTAPGALVTSDFNADGKPDIAVANQGANTFSVLLNGGSGAFAVATYPTITQPRSIAAGDVDGDGDSDLVYTMLSFEVVVSKNNGSGAFSSFTGVPAEASLGVALRDLNGDGKLDIALTSNNTFTVQVRFGNGNGTFSSRATYYTGGNPIGLTLADLDGDATLDIAVAVNTTNNVTTLKGDGSGGFGGATAFSLPVPPSSIAAGDLNGDGLADVAVSQVGASGVKVLLNTTAPADSTAPAIVPTVTGTLGADGWYTADAHLTWSVTDAQSPVSSTSGCDDVDVTADQASTDYTCTAASAGGSASEHASIKRDAIAPHVDVSGVADGAVYALASVPDAGCETQDATSGVATDATLSSSDGPTGSITATCSGASDHAGNSAGDVSVTYSVDATAPAIVPTVTGPLGSDGWYTGDAHLTWSVTDDESPVTSTSGCDDIDVTSDQLSTQYTCTATSTGGSASESASIKRDSTAPQVSVTGVAAGQVYTLGSVPVAGCSTQDATSGVASNATASSSGEPQGTVTVTCSGAEDHAGNAAADVGATYSVHYAFSAFLAPIDNGKLNSLKSGSAVPVKFSLSGNYGLAILATGSPSSQQVTCDTNMPTDEIEQTVTAGSSSLSYNPINDQYTYVWKTDKTWADSCRRLTVAFIDGSTHTALFKFTVK